MLREHLPTLIMLAGVAQLSVLVASALVPVRLNWSANLIQLSRLHRQMYWVYGGYTLMSIIALGLISIVNAHELAAGSLLARSLCLYIAVFWGVRLSLQTQLDAKPHLVNWWLTAGYHLLTVLFITFTTIFAIAAFAP
jgi:hypothetical protein